MIITCPKSICVRKKNKLQEVLVTKKKKKKKVPFLCNGNGKSSIRVLLLSPKDIF